MILKKRLLRNIAILVRANRPVFFVNNKRVLAFSAIFIRWFSIHYKITFWIVRTSIE